MKQKQMAVETTEAPEEKEGNILTEILDWMKENFSGDLDALSEAAATMAEEQGYISGALWDEIGKRTLRIYFREQVRFDRQYDYKSYSKTADEDGGFVGNYERPQATAQRSPYLILFQLPDGKWKNLGDMTKDDCLLLMEDYNKRARQNIHYSKIFYELASKLDGKIVSETFPEDELKELLAKKQD